MSAIRVDAKVVMLGKESVGKTSLVERYVHHRFLVGPYQNVSVSCFASACPFPPAAQSKGIIFVFSRREAVGEVKAGFWESLKTLKHWEKFQ